MCVPFICPLQLKYLFFSIMPGISQTSNFHQKNVPFTLAETITLAGNWTDMGEVNCQWVWICELRFLKISFVSLPDIFFLGQPLFSISFSEQQNLSSTFAKPAFNQACNHLNALEIHTYNSLQE